MSGRRTLWSAIRADLLAHDRQSLGPGWVPEIEGWRAWWHRYARNHHAGINVLYHVRQWALYHRVGVVPGACDRLMEWVHGTSIGRDVRLGTGVFFPHGQAQLHGQTRVGSHVTIGAWSGLGLRGGFFSSQVGNRGPTVGDYVTIGVGSRVLGDVKVGDRAVIGAESLVLDDVPEAATVIGVPARVVHQGPRAEELPAALARLQALIDMAEARRAQQSEDSTPPSA